MIFPLRILLIFAILGLSFFCSAQTSSEITFKTNGSGCLEKDGEISITIPDFKTGTIDLFDFKGVLISSKSIDTETIDFNNLDPGIYSVKIAQVGKPEVAKTVRVHNLNYEEEINVEHTIEDTHCVLGFNGYVIGKGRIFLNFSDFDATGFQSLAAYFFDDYGNNYQTTDAWDDTIVGITSYELDPGVYHVVLEWNGCLYPINRDFIINPLETVDFDVEPTYYLQCGEPLKIKPESEKNFDYDLFGADGELIKSGKEFEIYEAGIYYVQNKQDGYCSYTKQINVELAGSSQVPIVNQEGDVCEGKITLIVNEDLNGLNETDYTWYDYESDLEISKGKKLEVFQDGIYYVFRGADPTSLCSTKSLPIEVNGISVPFEPQLVLADREWCESVTNSLRLEGIPDDLEVEISWFFTNDNMSIEIPEMANLKEVEILDPGIYAVLIFLGSCPEIRTELVVDQIKSEPITLEPIYDLCQYDQTNQLILRGGNAILSKWYLEEELISEQATFSPIKPGNYRLENFHSSKCYIDFSFIVTGNCEASVRFTSGMSLSDPEKQFAVFTNLFVERLKIMIYDRWGQLIFLANENHPQINSPSGIWDGNSFGKSVTPGNYSLIVQYSGSDGKIIENRSVLTVID